MTQTPEHHIELENFWPYRATVLADQISRHTLSVVREEAGLNLSQWRVLAAVADKPGRTAAEVTAVTPMDKTIVSRAVNSLITSGRIKKTAHVDDRRRASLFLTTEGKRAYEKISIVLNQTLISSFPDKAAMDNFVTQLRVFSDMLYKIRPSKDGAKCL